MTARRRTGAAAGSRGRATVSRRRALQLAGLGAVGAAGLAVPVVMDAKSASLLPKSALPVPYAQAFRRPPSLLPERVFTDTDGVLHHEYTVVEKASTVSFVQGYQTPVWGYGGSVPGPTISVQQGTQVRLRVRNKLPMTHPPGHEGLLGTSVHLHGHASLPEFDGYADDITPPGYYKDYRYDHFQPARTLWYHDHGAHVTSRSVYAGLAAQYHLHDPVETALLPQGEYDVPLTLSDARFAADGGLAWDDRGNSGLWGDIVMVNGVPWPTMPVTRRVYRFRILNASISRSYQPYLSSGEPVHVVATDGGLVPRTQAVTTWRHAPAERYEVLVDFRKYAVGDTVRLLSRTPANNVAYDNTGKIMSFRVVGEADPSAPGPNEIPDLLTSSSVMDLTAAQAVRTRKIRLKRDDRTQVWTLNEQTWDDVVDSGYRLSIANPDLGDVELWELSTSGGGWFHPLHIHLVDFKVLSRNGRPPKPYELGPKDVVYVGEHETVRLLMRFEHHRGRYMVHCHNLVHEDHDMMSQFVVGLAPGEVDPHDPIAAARPQVDDLPDGA